jgi:hypothetical protein
MSSTSIFALKMALAASSPRKRSATEHFKASVVNSRDAAKQHPASKWLNANGTRKVETILSGSAAALLTVTKPNLINPISLLSPSESFDDRFRAHGHHDLWQAMGIYVNRDSITKHVISILDKATASDLGFPHIDIDLNTGLPNLFDNTQPHWKPNVIPDGMDSSGDDTTPVLVLITTMCPIGYGRSAPMGEIDALDTKALLQNCHDINLAWSNGVEYLIDKTTGKSIHMIDPVPAAFCDTYIPATQRPYWKAYLTDEVWTSTEAMNSQNEDFSIIKQDVDKLATHLMETYISTNDDARAAFSAPPANNTQSSAVANAIENAFNNIGSGTGTTVPDSTSKKYNLAAIRLLCVHHDDQNNQWELPKALHTRFEVIAKQGVKMGYAMQLHKGQTNFMNHLQGANRQYCTTNAVGQKYNRQFWSHFACAAWLTTPIRHGTDLTEGNTWNPFCLATQDANNDKDNEQIVLEDQEEKAGWEKADRTKASRDMTHNYDVNTYQTVVEMLANTSTFFQYATADDEGATSDDTLPWFSKQTERLLKVICHHEGRTWRTLLDGDYPWAWFKIAVRYTNIFALMADCALAPAINKAAQTDKAPVSTEARLERVKLAFDSLVTDINSAMENGDCGSLGNETPPPIWKQICVTRFQRWKRQFDAPAPTNTRNNTNPGGNGSGGGGGGKEKESDADKQIDKSKDKRQNGGGSRGLFTKPKSGGFGIADNAKYPKFNYKGENRELCVRFSTRQSRGCPFGANCNKFHLLESKWNELETAKKAEVVAFIAKAKNLDFAEGFKPAGKEKTKNKTKANKKARKEKDSDANADEPVEAIVIDEEETEEEEG